jgi:hypothetical protein
VRGLCVVQVHGTRAALETKITLYTGQLVWQLLQPAWPGLGGFSILVLQTLLGFGSLQPSQWMGCVLPAHVHGPGLWPLLAMPLALAVFGLLGAGAKLADVAIRSLVKRGHTDRRNSSHADRLDAPLRERDSVNSHSGAPRDGRLEPPVLLSFAACARTALALIFFAYAPMLRTACSYLSSQSSMPAVWLWAVVHGCGVPLALLVYLVRLTLRHGLASPLPDELLEGWWELAMLLRAAVSIVPFAHDDDGTSYPTSLSALIGCWMTLEVHAALCAQPSSSVLDATKPVRDARRTFKTFHVACNLVCILTTIAVGLSMQGTDGFQPGDGWVVEPIRAEAIGDILAVVMLGIIVYSCVYAGHCTRAPVHVTAPDAPNSVWQRSSR